MKKVEFEDNPAVVALNIDGAIAGAVAARTVLPESKVLATN